jgi:hypothetical protein
MAAYLMADVSPDDLDKNLASDYLDAAVHTASAQSGFYLARDEIPERDHARLGGLTAWNCGYLLRAGFPVRCPRWRSRGHPRS